MTTGRGGRGGRGAGGPGGGAGRPDAAGDDGGYGGRRVLPHDQRSLPAADRPARVTRDAYSGRRVLRVRLLPVRGPRVLDAGVGPRRERSSGPGAAAPAAGSRAARRTAAAPAGQGRAGVRKARRAPAINPPGGAAAFDLRLVRWMDAEKIDGFVAWQPFKHPTLGDVEIGGFKPYALSNPPAARLAELGKAHVEFVTYLSSLFPKVSIAGSTATSLGGGLYRIKAEVENNGFLPTSSAQGVRSRAVKPTMVQLGVDPADIVSGAPKTNFFQTLAGSGRRETYEWIVKGKPGSTITLKAVAQKGGTATAAIALK